MRALGQDTIMYAGGSRTFDESTGTYRDAPIAVEPHGPSMTAISDAGLCFDAQGHLVSPARAARSLWPPWYTEWSDYLAPKRERTSTMFTRSNAAWFTPPHTRALAALAVVGAPAVRRPTSPIAWGWRRYGLAGLGQDEWFGDWDIASWGLDTSSAAVPAVDVSSGFFSGVDWGAIGGATAEVFKAATPIAVPLLTQAIFGSTTPGRPAPPPGYTYSSTGQLMRLPSTMVAPGTPTSVWSSPFLWLGGAAAIGAGVYLMRGRRRR